MDSIPISKTISIKDAGFNEYWLQNQIWENPNCLGIGELESISKEKVTSSGGRLDILLKNPLDDSMYEVEVMLGETDASHIIRTIEYWDLIKRKWAQRQHFAVLVAERITKRFFNVIQLLSNSVPLIAIQANIIDIEGRRSLHFTKILDIYEEPEDEDPTTDEKYNEEYWKKKSISALEIAKKLFENTKDIYNNPTFLFRKSRITISCDGYNLNFARNIDFRATGSFFDFRRLNIQFQNSVQEISCLRKVQGKPAWPKRPLNPWSCPGTCHIQRFEKALHDRCPGIVNGIFDLFTVAVGNHLGGNE